MSKIININGDAAEFTSRAWWLDSACEGNNGRVEVARVHAVSTTLRLPSKEQRAADPRLNPYHASAENRGRYQSYMLGLTEDEIAQYGIVPGRLKWPEVVDGNRPATNRVDRVVSLRRQQQGMDWLQNDCIGQPKDY